MLITSIVVHIFLTILTLLWHELRQNLTPAPSGQLAVTVEFTLPELEPQRSPHPAFHVLSPPRTAHAQSEPTGPLRHPGGHRRPGGREPCQAAWDAAGRVTLRCRRVLRPGGPWPARPGLHGPVRGPPLAVSQQASCPLGGDLSINQVRRAHLRSGSQSDRCRRVVGRRCSNCQGGGSRSPPGSNAPGIARNVRNTRLARSARMDCIVASPGSARRSPRRRRWDIPFGRPGNRTHMFRG